MQFQVTQIEFDFEDDLYPMSEEECAEFYDDYVGTFWEAEDGDDLVEEITCAAGYCVKTIDYRVILDDIEGPEYEVEFDVDYTTQSQVYKLVGRPTSWQGGTNPLVVGVDWCNTKAYQTKRVMTDPCTMAMQTDMNILKLHIETDLQSFLLDTNADLNDAVDWVCDRFDLDATDDLIDFVADVHDAFFGM